MVLNPGSSSDPRSPSYYHTLNPGIVRGPQRLLHRRNGSDPPTNNRAAADQPWCQQPAFVWRIRPTSKLTVSRDRTCALRNPRNWFRQSYFASFAKAIELPWKPWGDFHRTAGTACQRQVKRGGPGESLRAGLLRIWAGEGGITPAKGSDRRLHASRSGTC